MITANIVAMTWECMYFIYLIFISFGLYTQKYLFEIYSRSIFNFWEIYFVFDKDGTIYIHCQVKTAAFIHTFSPTLSLSDGLSNFGCIFLIISDIDIDNWWPFGCLLWKISVLFICLFFNWIFLLLLCFCEFYICFMDISPFLNM